MSDFSDNMAFFRKKRGLTQTQLSKMMGTSVKMVSRWELDQSAPSVHTAALLADKLETSLDELTGRIEPDKEDSGPKDGELKRLCDQCQGLDKKQRGALKVIIEALLNT